MQPSNYDMSFSAWRVMVFAGNRRLAKSISRTFVRKRSQGGRAFMITKEKLPIDTLFFRDHVRRRCWLTPGGGRRDGCAAWCGWEPGGATGRGMLARALAEQADPVRSRPAAVGKSSGGQAAGCVGS